MIQRLVADEQKLRVTITPEKNGPAIPLDGTLPKKLDYDSLRTALLSTSTLVATDLRNLAHFFNLYISLNSAIRPNRVATSQEAR